MGAIELYDLDADPEEDHNLALDPDRRPQLEELAGILHGGWTRALPDHR